jgi:hypothetical protein
MKINNLSFPHPVLGNNDDIMPLPEVVYAEHKQGDTDYEFDFLFKITNETILDLVLKGFASYVCEVDCPSTLYRRSFKSNSPEFHIKIPRKSLAKYVKLLFTVAAQKPILGYSNPSAHKDYDGYTFNLEPGELLGVLGSYEVSVDITYDKLKIVDSIIQIIKDQTAETTWFDLNDQKIIIHLPIDLFNKYRESICGKRSWTYILHASILLNAVTYAILNINKYHKYMWARAICYRLQPEFGVTEKEIELVDAQSANKWAQLLLGDPYKRLFNLEFISDNN